MGYDVHTTVFEGPFDLLLHLILRQEVDLWEIDLGRIVDTYLASVERLGRLDLDVATEFLLIAATLVDLKARRLLPAPEASAKSDSAPSRSNMATSARFGVGISWPSRKLSK